MATRRWIRLDVGWEDSEWLDALDGTAAGCWPRLLCWVKRDGIKGRCKRPATGVIARRWRVPPEAVVALEEAAIGAQAMSIEEGEWVVLKWAEFQETDPTAADRMKKYRGEKSRLSPLHRNTVTNGVTGRNLSRATETETETETETTDGEGAAAPPKPSGKKAKQLPADWQPNDDHRKLAATLLNVRLSAEVQKFRDHFAANGKPMKDWDAAFRNWLRRAQEFAPTRPAPESQAATIHDELPRSTMPRLGADPLDQRKRQDAEDGERVNAWSHAHEGEAAALYADIREELAGDGTWKGAPAKMLDAKLQTEYKRRVLELLRPAAVA